jgi:hypothetical protein
MCISDRWPRLQVCNTDTNLSSLSTASGVQAATRRRGDADYKASSGSERLITRKQETSLHEARLCERWTKRELRRRNFWLHQEEVKHMTLRPPSRSTSELWRSDLQPRHHIDGARRRSLRDCLADSPTMSLLTSRFGEVSEWNSAWPSVRS